LLALGLLGLDTNAATSAELKPYFYVNARYPGVFVLENVAYLSSFYKLVAIAAACALSNSPLYLTGAAEGLAINSSNDILPALLSYKEVGSCIDNCYCICISLSLFA